jgi:hypothetical protein
MLLTANRKALGFPDHPLRSLRTLIRSQVLSHGSLQRIDPADSVLLTASIGYTNRCYIRIGRPSRVVAAAISMAACG